MPQPPLVLYVSIYGKILLNVYMQYRIEARMSWNPDEFTEYREYANVPQYADPAYYEQGEAPAPRSAQPAPPVAPSPIAPDMYEYDPGTMSAYRGPSSLEGYTHDAGEDQRELAKHGKISEIGRAS